MEQTHYPLLAGKTAAIFAANGAISREVAKAMAKAGAEVFLSGRNLEAVEALADEITAEGGTAYAYQVDALVEAEIENFVQKAVEQSGKIDVVFNGIGLRAHELQYGTPTTLLGFDIFMEAIRVSLGSQFLTSRIAARHMMATQTQGTIITLSASLSRLKLPFMAGITAACSGIEGMTRVMAAEFGQAGIKAICLNPTGLAETRTIQETNALNAKTMGIPPEVLTEQVQQGYLTGKRPSTRDIGSLAVFLATDTGALLNSHVIDADLGTMNVI